MYFANINQIKSYRLIQKTRSIQKSKREDHRGADKRTNSLSAIKKNQTVNDGVAHSKNPRKCAYHVTLTLTLSTPWMQAYLVTIVCKFGRDPAICLREAICAKVYRQTDDGRLAIVLTHSWNELKKSIQRLSYMSVT